MELSFWNFRSLNVSIAVYFRIRSRTLAFTPITQCEDQNNKIKKVECNGRECINKMLSYRRETALQGAL